MDGCYCSFGRLRFEGNLLRIVCPKIDMLVMLCLPGLIHRYSTWHSRFGETAAYTVTITALAERTLYRPHCAAILVTPWPQLPPTFPAESTFLTGDITSPDLQLHLHLQSSSEFDHHFAPTFPSMATLFHTEQVLIGQIGKYKIVKQLQKAVWLARYPPFSLSHNDRTLIFMTTY